MAVVVIGAGPAGMMAAIQAAKKGAEVILIERNPAPGRKLLLSGKGRCNLTNACDLNRFLERFSGNGDFLRDAFKKFFNHDLMDFFQSRGLALKTERQERVFPVTDRSHSILDVLLKEMASCGIKFLFKERVASIIVENGRVSGVRFSNAKIMPAQAVVLATGGASYAFSGSSGDGFRMAKELGHQVSELAPGLVPLVTKGSTAQALEGLTLKNIRLTFSALGREIVSEIGEMVFSAVGISGPLVFSLSGRIAGWLEKKYPVAVAIDLKPALTEDQVDKRLLREFSAAPKKSVRNVLKELMPLRLVDVFLREVKIPPDKQVSQLLQAERRRIVVSLKKFSLEVTGTLGMEEAMVTRGGISLKEINPRTMGSRLVKGLYFAGEVMDIDADTGGFNLQAAFSTGYLAGESAALYL